MSFILYFMKSGIGSIMLKDRNSGMVKKMIFEMYFRLGIFNNLYFKLFWVNWF